MYSDTGGDGPVVVLLHGVLMNGTLWDGVVGGLGDRYRYIVPELPFGAHTTPMPDDADFTLASLATMIAGFLTELDLRHVTVVCNDWGGAQLLISPGGTDRVANLVLVSCEAFDNLPARPARPAPVPQRVAAGRHLPDGPTVAPALDPPSPLAFGAMSKRRVPDDLFGSWIGPLRHNRKVRHDLNKYLRNVPKPKQLLEWADQQRSFPRPGPHRLGTRRQAHAARPRRTTSRTLPEHTTGVDRRQPNPHRRHVPPARATPPPHASAHRSAAEPPSKASVPVSCGCPPPVA